MTGLQDTINDYWTERAPSYDDYQRRPERRDLDVAAWSQIWSTALPSAPAAVLDVGTGSGHVAFLLAGLGHDVTGIDLADGMLERAREHASGLERAPRFEVGDAVSPPFPSQSFDAVVGRYVMWTLRDPAEAARHWLDLLRPGGTVAMVDSTWFPDGIGDLYDGPETDLPLAESTSIDDSAAVLASAGFAEVAVTPLESIYALDEQHGVAPGHHVQMQYLVTGRRER
ncbi:class I SAM-dependent methyltransferase [Nocardioides sp. C4-1]|uniref:class I SAM-dependent methyltransferase n=1 Tax=Nocardioides sp. C4-1 TaxID=3151851 RepID=UPI003266B0B3